MIPTLAATNPIVVTILVVVFLLICIAMILLILIQRPQGGGLSGAFGAGGGAGQTAFGTKTGDVLTLVTIAIFVLFLGMAVALNFAARPSTAPAPGVTASPIGDEIPSATVEDGTPAVADTDTDEPAIDLEIDPVVDDSEPSEANPESDGGTP